MGVLFVAASGVCAQSGRKAISNPAPQYPTLARQFHLAGTVRLEVVIAPNGQVKETKVLGGNPLLADAAVRAVKDWKFVSAPSETVEQLEFKFQP